MDCNLPLQFPSVSQGSACLLVHAHTHQDSSTSAGLVDQPGDTKAGWGQAADRAGESALQVRSYYIKTRPVVMESKSDP